MLVGLPGSDRSGLGGLTAIAVWACLAGGAAFGLERAVIGAGRASDGWRRSAMRVAPVVALWYRGEPDGIPRRDDLAAIRAVGFTQVAWPTKYAAAFGEVQGLAGALGLSVQVRAEPRPLTMAEAVRPGAQVDVDVTRIPGELLTAVVWRAVAHGARDIAFDPGSVSGAGLGVSSGPAPAWLAPAIAVARQLRANATLFAAVVPAATVRLDAPLASSVDVALRETDRTWLLVATNLADAPARFVAHLPPGVPPALWVSLLDGTAMSMFDAPGGPQWTVTMAGGGAAVYVIDKNRE